MRGCLIDDEDTRAVRREEVMEIYSNEESFFIGYSKHSLQKLDLARETRPPPRILGLTLNQS